MALSPETLAALADADLDADYVTALATAAIEEDLAGGVDVTSTATVPDVFKRTVLQQECPSSCPTNQAGWERIEVDYVTIDNQQ